MSTPSIAPTPVSGSAGAALGGARHALIIEDDLIIGLELQSLLQPLGFGSFAFASTPDQAREQALLQAPDLTTVDIGLLDGDGLAAVRAVEGVCGAVATIFITGDPQAAEAQGDGRVVLAKPVTTLDLKRALAAAERGAPLPR